MLRINAASKQNRFIVQPQNKSVRYGEFVDFECRVHLGGLNTGEIYHLEILIGNGTEIHRLNLDSREYFAEVQESASMNESAGLFWIIINGKTAGVVKSFKCSFIHGRNITDSSEAFIHVSYPECILQLQPSTRSYHTLYTSVSSVLPAPSRALISTSTKLLPSITLETCSGVLRHNNTGLGIVLLVH